MNPDETRRDDGLHPPAARRAGHHDPADRARHEGGDGRSPSGSRCSTTARRSPRARRPRSSATRGDRGLPGQGSAGAAAAGRAAACRRGLTPALLELDRRPHLLRQHPRPQGRVARRSTKGEIVTLIGANGAGKTHHAATISGLVRPREGDGHASTASRSTALPAARRSSAWASPRCPRAGASSAA